MSLGESALLLSAQELAELMQREHEELCIVLDSLLDQGLSVAQIQELLAAIAANDADQHIASAAAAALAGDLVRSYLEARAAGRLAPTGAAGGTLN